MSKTFQEFCDKQTDCPVCKYFKYDFPKTCKEQHAEENPVESVA